jgi:hypothetical protein
MPLLRDAALVLPPLKRLYDSRSDLASAYVTLEQQYQALAARAAEMEAQLRVVSSPFMHFHTVFDPTAYIRKYAVPDLKPTPGYLTNFLGVLIDPKYFPTILDGRAGQIDEIPIPGNFHADAAEWGVALRAIDLAGPTFTMIELGCGWGCWMNNTGVVARRAGKRVSLTGVEGDVTHVQFANECCKVNGFSDSDFKVHRGIAAANSGVALFPRQERGGMNWGLAPIFGATSEQRAESVQNGTYDELPMIGMDDLLAKHVRVDLLHIDIQGGETDLVHDSLSLLNEKVAYMLIGTHSREIDGRLFEDLRAAGWVLELERAAILQLTSGQPECIADGVEGWRNPRLSAN